MATVAELERLLALVGRLEPLADARRGELIRSDDWNTVVASLIEVARAIVSSGGEGNVPPHDHPDQVSVGWLDPRLRELVERGPLADPANVARVAALERQHDRLNVRVNGVNSSLGEVRDHVTEVTTRDLERASEVTRVRRVVEGIGDGREDVRALRETLRTLAVDVQRAVEVGSRLDVNGRMFDAAATVDRIRQLEQLHERLRRPDGALFDASALELRLTELTNTLVTEGQLDEALESHVGGLDPDAREGLLEDLRTSVLADVDTRNTQLAGSLRAELTEALSGVDARVAQSLADAAPAITESAASTIRPEITSAVSGAREEARTDAARLVDESRAELSAALEARTSEVAQSISPTVAKEVEAQLTPRLQELTNTVVRLGQRIERVDSRLDQHDVVLRDLPTRLNVLESRQQMMQDELRAELMADIDRREAELNESLRGEVAQLMENERVHIDAVLLDQRRELQALTRTAVAEAVTTEFALAETRLQGTMRTIARDELTGTEDLLRSNVRSEVDTALKRLPGLVADEISRVNVAQPELIRRELEGMQPEFRRIAIETVNERLGPA